MKRKMATRDERDNRLEKIRMCVVEWLDEHNGVSISRREISTCSGVGSTGIINLYVKKLIDQGSLTIVGEKADARVISLPNSTFIIPWNDRDGIENRTIIHRCEFIMFDGDTPPTLLDEPEIPQVTPMKYIETIDDLINRLSTLAPRSTVVFAHKKETAAIAAALGCAVIRY